MNRIWNGREKQIQSVMDNITGFYGSIDGLIGGTKELPEIKLFALTEISPDNNQQ
jgi:hypothetical protein